jgi:hypothetical protein
MAKCFVIMPFDKGFATVYAAIKKAVASSSTDGHVTCTRLDDIKAAGPITLDLVQELREATLCIADMTGNRPNVLWEVGYAMAFGKPVLLITQNSQELPFDVKDLRWITYNPKSVQRTLSPKLAAAVRETLEHPEKYFSPMQPKQQQPAFAPNFASGIRRIVGQLKRTKKRLYIVCDFAGYLHFSEPDLFEQYWKALTEAIARCNDVKVILYDRPLYQKARRKQLSSFERLRKSPNYQRFIRQKKLQDFNNLPAFLQRLDRMEEGWRKELAALTDLRLRSVPFWMFQWLNETNHVVYSLQPTDDPNDEMVFESDDPYLAEAMRQQFVGKLWPRSVQHK